MQASRLQRAAETAAPQFIFTRSLKTDKALGRRATRLKLVSLVLGFVSKATRTQRASFEFSRYAFLLEFCKCEALARPRYDRIFLAHAAGYEKRATADAPARHCLELRWPSQDGARLSNSQQWHTFRRIWRRKWRCPSSHQWPRETNSGKTTRCRVRRTSIVTRL